MSDPWESADTITAPPESDSESRSEPTAPPTKADTEDAPYGLTKDGRPRRRPGPARDPRSGRSVRRARAAARGASSSRAKAPPRKPTPNRPTSAAPGEWQPANELEAGAITLVGIPVQILASAGVALSIRASMLPEDNPSRARADRLGLALGADAAATINAAPALASGAAALAERIPMLAAVLERAARLGPHAESVAAGLGLIMQIGCNHGMLPVSPILRTRDPAELVAEMFEAQQAE